MALEAARIWREPVSDYITHYTTLNESKSAKMRRTARRGVGAGAGGREAHWGVSLLREQNEAER